MSNSNSRIKISSPINSDGHWAWLQERLQLATVMETDNPLDAWLREKLEDLEYKYSDMITVSSLQKLARSILRSPDR